MRFKLLLALLLLFTIISQAQQSNLPLNRSIYDFYEPALNQKGVQFHTAVKPYRIAEVDSIITYEAVFPLQKTEGEHFMGKVWNRIAYGDWVTVSTSDFHLAINPLINFAGGMELESGKGVWINTRGFEMHGDIGPARKFSFATTFRENQSKFPDYVTAFVKDYNVVPGQGKVRNFKSTAFDYANATGYVSYTPNKYVNFQLGTDKNFIGDGYRSMLLSDNSIYYPFFKINTQVWKIKYTNIWTEYIDAMAPVDSLIGVSRKWGSYHYLSYDACDWLQIGLFEGIIWMANDSSRYRGLDVNYLNPIIFFRPIEFGLGSPDNALMGLNVKLKPINNAILYGQFLLDDLDVAAARAGDGFYRTKIGLQAGVKYYLNSDNYKHAAIFQLEMNQASPYTYAHKDPEQNYAHYNQPIAHPLGANFREWIAIANYRFLYRYYVNLKLQFAMIGLDSSKYSNVGSNIYISDYTIPNFPDSYGNYIGQGLKTHIHSVDLRLGYLLNPRINMNIELQYLRRSFENKQVDFPTQMVMLAFKTDLFNAYYDF